MLVNKKLMTQKLDVLLLKAKDLIASGELNDADGILGSLKSEYPLSQDVARLWCSLAMRTDRTAGVPAYAAEIYAHVQGDFHKAHWACLVRPAFFY